MPNSLLVLAAMFDLDESMKLHLMGEVIKAEENFKEVDEEEASIEVVVDEVAEVEVVKMEIVIVSIITRNHISLMGKANPIILG